MGGLHVSVQVDMQLPNGQLVTRNTRCDFALNPADGDFKADVELAKAAARTLAGEALERADQHLDDWAETLTQHNAELQRRLQGDDD